MRCGRIDDLIERYIDGRLPAPIAESVTAHARGCGRCSERIAAARLVTAAFAGGQAVRAPDGFSAKVMDAVYREAFAGSPTGRNPAAPQRAYRRMGLSFVLTAGVLALSLIVPRFSYTRLIMPENLAAGLTR